MKEKRTILKPWFWLLLAAWVYTLTFVFNHYWSKYASYESVTKSFQKLVTEKEHAFSHWVEDTATLQQLALGTYESSLLTEVQQQPFFVFIYNREKPAQPVFWSTNAVVPDFKDVLYSASGSFKKYGNGKYEFLKRTAVFKGQTYDVVGLLLLHQEFYIENSSLPKKFPGFPGLEDKMDLATGPTAYPIKGEAGNVLLYFNPLVEEPIFVFNWASFIVQCIASFFLLIFISKLTTGLIRNKKIMEALLFFGAVFFLLRFLVLRFDLPIEISRLPLLKPAKNSDVKLDEFGRLFVNAFFALWSTSFITRHTTSLLQFIKRQGKFVQWGIVACLAVSVVFAHFFLVTIIKSLYLNSAVAFDITNFLSLNSSTILSFFILFLLCASHYMYLRFLGLVFQRITNDKKWIFYALMVAVGLLVLSYMLEYSESVLPLLFSLLWLLLFFVVGANKKIKPAPATFGATVVWLLIYSFSLSLLLGFLGDNRLHNRTKELAKSIVLKKNPTSESEIRHASAELRRRDWASILYTCYNEDTCQQIKDSLVRSYLGGYLNRYSSDIYLFDRAGDGVNNEDDVTLESLNTLFETQGEPTGYPNVYHFSESYDKFGYIIRDDIKSSASNEKLGTLFVVVRSGNLPFAPEPFKQLQDFKVDLPQGYSFAWYKDGLLTEQYRNYPFPTKIPKALDSLSLWENKGAEAYELWSNAGSNSVLSLAAQRKVPISFISMLAYLFGAFLLFYMFMAGVNLLLRGNFFSARTFTYVILNLQNKIRITVVSILLLSFIIVAVVTISFFINQFKTGNEDHLAKSVQAVSTDLSKQLARLPVNFDNLTKREQKNTLREELKKITVAQNLDANFYDSSGKNLVSSQEQLFNEGLISPMLNPMVWWQMKEGKSHRYIISEEIGNLKYISIYQPVRLQNNRVYGYLQVPYYVSQNELNQEISNFLVILINIIAFVFLLSGGLAFWISGSITKSFNIIAGKMDRIRLSERNERIVWNRNDEIGHLVSRYNKMVDQLEESAQMMARTERELAWREMARQVAHEIKNPLTPMKLSLQFLQKAIREKSADVDKISERVAGNLVGQIDHLSNIATEFSQFANLGNYNPELFDLQALLEDMVQLYDMQENVTVKWEKLPFSLMIKADKTQVNRLFTNLFQNAVEAAGEEDDIILSINEELRPNSVVISITDNGMGIPEAVQPNIFRPNFTTKSAGTGLGLAICKAIVENAAGQISFTTEAGKGTRFFVQFPLSGVEV